MEKQRIKRHFKSGRRFLVTLFLLFGSSFIFSQSFSLAQIKQLRIVPELSFFEDTTLDYAQHIDDVLKKDPVRKSEESDSQE